MCMCLRVRSIDRYRLYDPMDFCGDLETWTAEILKEGTEGPRIHSVSYGWQGNLTQVSQFVHSIDRSVDLRCYTSSWHAL